MFGGAGSLQFPASSCAVVQLNMRSQGDSPEKLHDAYTQLMTLLANNKICQTAQEAHSTSPGMGSNAGIDSTLDQWLLRWFLPAISLIFRQHEHGVGGGVYKDNIKLRSVTWHDHDMSLTCDTGGCRLCKS